jgi:hypothetical protein
VQLLYKKIFLLAPNNGNGCIAGHAVRAMA